MKTEQGKNTKERKHEGKCKISGQNMHEKAEKRLHVRRILTVHVAPNCSNIKVVINASYTEYEASDKFVLILSNRWQFEQEGS